MPQTKYETSFILEWNASEVDPLYWPEGRAALGGLTIPEWMAAIGFEDQVTDPKLLAEIQERLGLPDRPGGAFTMRGAPFLVFYEDIEPADGDRGLPGQLANGSPVSHRQHASASESRTRATSRRWSWDRGIATRPFNPKD